MFTRNHRVIEGYESPSAITKMADNNAPVIATRNEDGSATNGDNASSPQRGQRGGRSQGGRGGRGGVGGRGRGRDQNRANRKGFGSKSNEKGGRQQKSKKDMGRGEYKYVHVDPSEFLTN